MSVSVLQNYIFVMEKRQRAVHQTESGPVNSSVKRCLFGERPDTSELQRKCEDFHKEEMRQKEKKWGFNFETETPTDNLRFQWERVHSGVPPSYAMFNTPSGTAPPSEVQPEVLTPPVSEPATNAKQRLITDYMRQKRHASSSSSGSQKRLRASPIPAEEPQPAISAEQKSSTSSDA